MTPSEDKARPIEAQGHDDIAASLPDQARELLRGARKLVGGAIGIDADHAFRTLSAIDAFLAGQPAPPVSIGEKLTATVETAFRAYIARTSPLLSEHGIARTWEHFREHLEAAEKAARSPRVVTGEPWPFSIPSVEQGGSRLGPCDAFRSSADAREICGVCGFRAHAHRGPLGGIVSHEPPFTKLVPIDEPTHPGALIVGCIPDDEEAPVVESPNAQEDDMAHLTAAMVMAIRGMIARGLTPKEGVGKISEALMKAVDAALPLGAAPVGVSNAEPPKR